MSESASRLQNLRHVAGDGLFEVARLGSASGCRPFRANHIVVGPVPGALPQADGFCAVGAPIHPRHAYYPHRVRLPRGVRLPRQRRNDSTAQGNALGTRPKQTISALKGQNSAGNHAHPFRGLRTGIAADAPPTRRFHVGWFNPTHIARHTPPCIAPKTSGTLPET